MKTLSWDKIQQGDEEAFRQLYEQYADLLYLIMEGKTYGIFKR